MWNDTEFRVNGDFHFVEKFGDFMILYFDEWQRDGEREGEGESEREGEGKNRERERERERENILDQLSVLVPEMV